MATETPNLFTLQGRNLHVTYSTTGIDGKPSFVYHDASHSLVFKGDQIRTVESEIGTLVSVTIRVTVDLGATSFTLLVPAVNLPPAGQAPITTIGITTIHRTFLSPPLGEAQTELYSVARVTGTASLVAF